MAKSGGSKEQGKSVAWLVDGMNLIGSRPDGWWRDRDRAMRALVVELGGFAESSGDHVTVVFDTRPEGGIEEQPKHGVQVAFARRSGPDAADDEIVRRAALEVEAGSIRVVTSDRELIRRLKVLGAGVESPGHFRRRLETTSAGGAQQEPEQPSSR